MSDLDGFERIWLLYWFDRARPAELVVTPYLDTTPRGLPTAGASTPIAFRQTKTRLGLHPLPTRQDSRIVDNGAKAISGEAQLA